MNIAVAADHAGFSLKEQLKKHLQFLGNEIQDVGTFGKDSVDYPEFGRKAALLVAEGKAERAVLVCGSGIGMSMVANKVKGIRAANCVDTKCAILSRQHNDANVLCLGARFLGAREAKAITEVWLATPFEGGRHERRIKKIDG